MSGPYGAAARAYFESGWSPVSFPPKTKWPPVDGYTGGAGKYLDEVTLKRWLKAGASVSAGNMSWVAGKGNIGLRLPRSILGIDVDMYEGKAGRETLAAAEKAWGALPDTWFTSSRTDGSGIRLFRIPEGLAWPGKLPQGGGVELIRWDHRYAMVSPSIHDKTGEMYRWYKEVNGEGFESPDEFPDPDDVPDLLDTWIEGLTSGKRWESRAAADMTPDDVRNWLSDRLGPDMCSTMARTLTHALRAVRVAGDDGGAHDAGRDGAWALIGDAQSGHAGIETALARLRKAFLEAISRRADERLSAEEWARIVVRGVQKVAAEGEAESADLCALLRSSGSGSNTSEAPQGTEVGSGRNGSGTFDYARDDIGNAQRLVTANRHEIRHTDALGGWHVWSDAERRWTVDSDGDVRRRAISVVRDMEAEAGYIEDATQKAAFLKFVRGCGNVGRLAAMVSVAADLNGMTLPASAWDANGAFLGTPDAHIELCRNPGIESHPATPERLMTRSTGTRYIPGAKHPVWDAFLDRFVPDREVRHWLQRLAGYTLHGGNPRRLFVVCFGLTSTGKTTFAEALRIALGDYGGITNLTVFRDNQDERARADLVSILSKRFVYAEEASQSWHLHPDQVKRLTGGSPVKARLPFAREYVESRPAFTPWLLTNSAPTIEGADDAFWRRLLVVPFDSVIKQDDEDDEFGRYLYEPAFREAVLAWAIEGWIAYAATRDLSAPASTIPAYEKFRMGVSDLDSFLAEACDIGSDFAELPVVLYSAYKLWCAQNGVRDVKSNTAFGRFLSGRGIERKMSWTSDGPRYMRAGARLNTTWKSLTGGNA